MTARWGLHVLALMCLKRLTSSGEELLVSNGDFISIIDLVLAHKRVRQVARTNLFEVMLRVIC